MSLTQEQYTERTQKIIGDVRSASWGIRGIAQALTKNDLDCEIEDVGKLSLQDICDLHCAALSLSQRIDESMQWLDTARVDDGELS